MNFSTLAFTIPLIYIHCSRKLSAAHQFQKGYTSYTLPLSVSFYFPPYLSIILLLANSSKKESITKKTKKKISSTKVMTARKVQSGYCTMNDLESPNLRHAN